LRHNILKFITNLLLTVTYSFISVGGQVLACEHFHLPFKKTFSPFKWCALSAAYWFYIADMKSSGVQGWQGRLCAAKSNISQHIIKGCATSSGALSQCSFKRYFAGVKSKKKNVLGKLHSQNFRREKWCSLNPLKQVKKKMLAWG